MYERAGSVEDPAEGTQYASVTSHGDNRVKWHSRIPKYVEGSLPESFLDTLRLFANQNRWDSTYMDNDEEVIMEAILNGTLF